MQSWSNGVKRLSWSHSVNKLSFKRYSTDIKTIKPLLNDIRRVFPDRYNLYARIQLALNDDPITKIAIIPFHTHRNNIKNVLETLIADPLASNQTWFKALQARMLSKDSLITYNPRYSYVKSSNTLNEYPVPFRVPPHCSQPDASKYQFVEINSWNESKERVLDCQMHVFVSKNDIKTALTSQIPSAYPSLIVIDAETLAGSKLGDNVVTIDTELAINANELLSQSPSNATLYTSKFTKSQVGRLQERLFRSANDMRHEILISIRQTCNSCVTPRTAGDFNQLNELTEKEAENIKKLREKWSTSAHSELQSNFTETLDTLLYSTLAWWKLYYKVDDIHDITSRVIALNFLPNSKSSLDYLVGRIDAFADKNYDMATSELKAPISDELSVYATEDIIDQASILHNQGLKALTISVFGIQLPCIIIPLLGWYFFDYSFYSMASIIAFGAVISFRNLQKSWLNAAKIFKSFALQRAREALFKSETEVWNRWEAKVMSQQKVIRYRSELARKLEDVLEKK